MRITEATPSDLEAVLHVERLAFGQEDEADLTRALLEDPTAAPRLSLLAFDDDGRPIGHILFTAATIEGAPRPVMTSILAPLAVVPDAQRSGVGGALIARGVEMLAASGTELVFVAGHPEYYPRHGFEPAGRLGFIPPHPVPVEFEDAWMVRAMREGLLGETGGRVTCARSLDHPEMWRE